jgi:hypothetical protein
MPPRGELGAWQPALSNRLFVFAGVLTLLTNRQDALGLTVIRSSSGVVRAKVILAPEGRAGGQLDTQEATASRGNTLALTGLP